jgi:hypothetical protein
MEQSIGNFFEKIQKAFVLHFIEKIEIVWYKPSKGQRSKAKYTTRTSPVLVITGHAPDGTHAMWTVIIWDITTKGQGGN